MNRRLIIRIAFVVLIILLGVWMFFIGKQHTLLLDNKTVGDYKALDYIYVTVDKQDELEITKRMRDQAVVTGQSHRLIVKYTDSSWNEVTLEKKIKFPLNENMMLLSLPVLIANPDAPQSEWLTHFESMAVTADTSSSEEIVTTEDVTLTDF